jgi:hypothetical protein
MAADPQLILQTSPDTTRRLACRGFGRRLQHLHRDPTAFEWIDPPLDHETGLRVQRTCLRKADAIGGTE